ncbi:carboxypeptidase B-like [Seriola lalandi dorsalis]|uniref:Carboxypeptidase B n=1 Tax=Seriola lalandi dorsalis TaxID=1841481 RepID=A0A3B4XU15_SERLL|nr:carboxypeptidase B-like [Seriola lalandi dorsalis]XP_056220279.1 carboxypeptidase B isoform X2 [Seriola aureovittata]
MKVLLLFGLVAVALAGTTRFEGEKVFRLKPVLDEHVTLIKELAKDIEVDFWRPESPELVTIDIDVDIRVPAMYLDMVHTILQQNDMEHVILIDDLQTAVEAQAQGPTPRAHSYTKYNSWDKIQSWISSIASSNSNLISKQVIGNTYEGRPMTILKLGRKSSSRKPAIFMDCGIHAREWISPAFCQWFVKEAMSTYGQDSQMTSLLNEMDVFVLPVFNIDGYDYTHKSNRMWRKTRSRKSGSSCIGTDPNRNFNAGWCTTGASSNPCSDTFCGYSPESEIEVKNVADFIRRNKSIIKAYITVHSYSQLLLFPYSYTFELAATHSELLKVAEGASAALRSLYGTRYTSGPGAATIYPAAGGSDDWAYDLGVKYSYTFELRDTGRYGFLLPESQIKPTCEETMLAVKYIAAYVQKNLY